MSQDTGSDDVPSGKTASSKGQAWSLIGPVTAAFALVVTAAAVAAYRFGEGIVYIGDRTISEMNFVEVTGGAALGVLGALASVGAAGLGAVVALVATIVATAMGALGVALGSLLVIGFVSGPILLVVVIGILIKRRYWPDVI
ncbi:hypothetical protein [Parvularcula marina]|uniref:hypothetical protein n=1 Tax=Parvularcula marina TaxID=2292771 RepID=UPI0011C06CB4|nr:hypothetical protein [Parvularcula marina]